MYEIYRWKIKPTSSYITPWQSDTIYGHLLWGISLLYGGEEIDKTIEEFKAGNPPFITSNGFIDGKLPIIRKETLKREINKEFADKLKSNLSEIITKRKTINKISSIDLKEFNKLRENYSNKEFIFERLKESFKKNKTNKEETIVTSDIVMHNTINRLSGTTTEDGGLYFSKETFTDKEIDIFIKLRKDYSVEKLKKLLDFVEMNGYGKKASSGKGSFRTVSFKKFDGFKKIKNGDGFVVLSNYIPKEKDYEEVVYGTPLVKFGKVGNDSEYSDMPFKKPFTCFTPGSLFKNGENEIVGKALGNIHHDKRVVQIGIPFTLEVKL